MAQQKRNPSEFDLEGLDLEFLEEFETQPKHPKPSRAMRWTTLLLLLSSIIGLYFLARSSLNRGPTQTPLMFFILSLSAFGLTFLGGRWLWAWVEESAKDAPQNAQNKPPRIIGPVERWVTLLATVGGIVGLLIWMPSNQNLGSGNWLLTTLAGIVVAVLGGRWLILHAQRPAKNIEEIKPFAFPLWLKWVNLVILVVLVILMAFASLIFGGAIPESTLTVLGLFIGVYGAVWLSRRFEELEEKIKQNTKKRK